MRTVTIDNIQYKLSDLEWEELCKQFDAAKSTTHNFGYHIMYIRLPCAKRRYKCVRCSLRDPYKKVNSCTYFFRRIIGEELFPYIHLFDHAIIWDSKFDSEARHAIGKVMDVLRMAIKS